jgi:methyl-accepting chemotaxis protein
MNETRKAIRKINRAVRELEEQIRKINSITIRLKG